MYRGKDITETQDLLEKRLGITKDLYIAGAYYNEFSPSGLFFTSKAKDRRELLEKIADLSFPVKLLEGTQNERKRIKKIILETIEDYNKKRGKLEQLEDSAAFDKQDAKRWSEDQKARIEKAKIRSEKFEETKAKRIKEFRTLDDEFAVLKIRGIKKAILDLAEAQIVLDNNKAKCNVCGQENASYALALLAKQSSEMHLNKLESNVSPYFSKIIETLTIQNTEKSLIEELEAEKNPFEPKLDKYKELITELNIETTRLDTEVKALNKRKYALEYLVDLSLKLRSLILKQSIKRIENETNRYLSIYFDSEISVQFILQDLSDDLDVLIKKDGHECVYRQLSKGQRGLLKLCFSICIMEAASNRSGIHFDTLCFDESLDGLDGDLKTKAFRLFQELSLKHDTVLVIDHAEELKSLFDSKYTVSLCSNGSEIEKS